MSNSEEAFSTIAREFISKYNLEESNCDLFRRKFSNIKSERKIYLKEKDLATWEELLFCRDPQMDDIPQSSNEARPFKESTIAFEEDFSRVSRKHISELSNKDSSCFLLDSLEIGKSKYIDLRRILTNEDITLPGYNRVAIHRCQICLIDEMEIVEREYPVGIGISYHTLLTHTVNRIISTNTPIDSDDQPLKIRISDGLDGLGSHRVYQQATSHPN
ncbi:hypothetical protein LOD99_13274 [Oopsacas minuta]|uniref:Uncharacterized protein n=1 Tax=Oopsacas minuta TaxID=111878 RepID=A0AAV7KKJ7_9METZ|nr:hypothetical protein LOD99_13274 [Oopsacas minuta]